MQQEVKHHYLNLTYEDYCKDGKNLAYFTIGPYSIFEEIGRGGFGAVYKGMNDQNKHVVAVKVLDIQAILDQEKPYLRTIKLKLSQTESLMMEKCCSAHLIKCYDVYENKALKIMILEYCAGGTLQNYIDAKGKIEEKQAILILKQIISGIAELHSKKIVHRDLKAENILIHNGIFKIADFGFSKQLNEDQATGTLLGTITTMAPEVMKREKYGLKADIWSIGVIFFQMIYGKVPFTSRDRMDMIKEIDSKDILSSDKFVYNGVKASKEIQSFLRQILVIDQRKRIGWKELLKHPIFIDRSDNKLPRSQIPDIGLPHMSEDSDLEIDPDSPEDSPSKFIKNITAATTTGQIVRRISKNLVGLKRGQIKKTEEDQIFECMNTNLVQCLKTELIYEEIFEKIEKNSLLDLEQREVKEFMYMLTARCFLNISPINAQMQKHKNKYQSIGQIFSHVTRLYERMKVSWQNYCVILKDEQDRVISMIKDWFESKEQKQIKDKYLNGIESQDYNKKDQLDYIEKTYINKFKNQLRKSSDPEFAKVRKYLVNYKEINLIDPVVFQKQHFDVYIEKMIQQ